MIISRYLVVVISLFIFFPVLSQQTLNNQDEMQYFTQGVELFNKEKYGAARKSLEKYLQFDKRSIYATDAEYFIAQSSLALFNPDGEDKMVAFVDRHPESSKSNLGYYQIASF